MTAGTAEVDQQGDVLASVRVADVMHRGVLGATVGASLRDLARTMAENRVHCVVVSADDDEPDADLEGRLWGVVSDLDLACAAADDGDRCAGDLARSPIVLVSPDDSLAYAVQLMRDHRVTHLIVAPRAATYPLGVLSALDVARALA
jgi:CBS domain-containing protein